MHLNRNIFSTAVVFILCFTALQGTAQLGFSFDIKKPDQYDDRVLGSEKSEQKKFSLPRRFIQNTFTHYNYLFNAKNKLNEIVEQAKSEYQDDFTKLLSFYNYSLEATQQNKSQLDSVIYKSTTGIVLHDLRNDWIDNLYLLTGAAYYLRKQFDSAYLTFQFINYAFADKEKDGYYKNIGSRLDGNNALSISTKEKNSLPKKIFSEQPSRNDSFIWLIRTLIAQEEYAEAASLIVTLKNDPVFPKRLKNDLEEVQALWFYNNNVFDSAAFHLSKSLDNATTKNEKARWEFLIAQLYELNKDTKMAKSFYEKVIGHTVDPVMEIYARLNSIRINKEGGDNYIDKNIADLLKMEKRDKYSDYRDIIYFTVAEMEMERGNSGNAFVYFSKSTEYNTSNTALNNKAFLQMADISFAQKKYKQTHNFYDSLNFSDPELLKERDNIYSRMNSLAKISKQIEIIQRQDSLQRIALLPEQERKEYVRKMVRQIRKEQGLKEEPSTTLIPIGNTPAVQTDLFSTSSKSEWYFYNTSLRSKGVGEFKAKWGNRANADNWRRSAGINFTQQNRTLTGNDVITKVEPDKSVEISFDALFDLLPLTEEKIKISNDSVSNAMYILGKALAEEIEDCNASIKTFEDILTRFPKHEKLDSIYFSLFYCYTKTGETTKAAVIKKKMLDGFPENSLTTIVVTGKDPHNKFGNAEATKAYEHIYDLFLEGSFAEAVAKKAEADKQYGSNYWTPRLLYIESVYYIKQKKDDKALTSLGDIVQMNPGTPIAEKASRLMDVLSRRKEIEEEISKLNIERPKEEISIKTDTVSIKKPELPKQEIQKEKIAQPVVNNQPVFKPTIDTIVLKTAPTPYIFKEDDKYYVMLLLNKLDLVWANEAKNAFNMYNRGNIYNKQFELNVTEISSEFKALLIGNFDNAQAAADYVKKVKPLSANQILPWLKEDKYIFSVITPVNLEILKSQKDINLYRQFISKSIPGIF